MQNTSQKILDIKDILIMTVVANLGIRWIPVAAGMGPISLMFWFIGALFFFLPLALIVSELSRLYPKEGGMFAWVQQSLGNYAAFIVAWLYWINSIFYYPAALTFLAANFAYAINKPNLANNQEFVSIVVLVSFWSIIALSTHGIKINKWINRFGGALGIGLPISILIILGFSGFIIFHHSATSFASKNFLPHYSLINNLSSLSILMFAMAGVEIIPTLANSIRDPSKTLPRGLLLATLVIFLLYALGTLAMNFIADPQELTKTTGMMKTFHIINLKFHIDWLTPWIAGLLVVAEFAGLGIWIIAPTVMFFNCTPTGILPQKLHVLNQYGAPRNALIFQGALVTAILLLTNFLPSVNTMYEALVLMATILYFIPYLILVIAYLKIRKTSSRVFLNAPLYWLAGIAVFLSVTLGIVLSFVPSSDLTTLHAKVTYETELILGPVIFITAGMLLYGLKVHKNNNVSPKLLPTE